MKKRGRRKIGTTETDSSVWIVVLIYAICIPKRNKHPVDPVRIEPEPTSIDSNQFTRRRSSTGRCSCTQGAAACRALQQTSTRHTSATHGLRGRSATRFSFRVRHGAAATSTLVWNRGMERVGFALQDGLFGGYICGRVRRWRMAYSVNTLTPEHALHIRACHKHWRRRSCRRQCLHRRRGLLNKGH